MKRVLSLPYSETICGIYKIVNLAKDDCYVGQSQNIKKRVSEHFRLLRNGRHVNQKLQHSFNKYGEDNFKWSVEVVCENVNDLDSIENAFLKGDANFVEPTFYNIADAAKVPMRGRKHSEAVRAKIKKGRRATSFNYQSDEYRKKLSDITSKRLLSNPVFLAKVRYIVHNDGISYAARGRAVSLDTSSTRKLYLRYKHMKGVL